MDIFDAEAVRFRAEMIELMMLSHPHDCPVCDEGGECHLQDMTVMTGHSYRRYRGRKRTFENQDLGPFVTHELNRCITCYRCARFYNEYAGGRDFGVFGLRNQVYFGRAESGTLESEFSGNLIEVCPTGVFDDKPFSRRYSRKWDLQTAPSVCPDCGLGCTTTLSARNGELRRVQGRFNRDVNKMFLCDRGRFGFEFVNAPQRVRAARVAPGLAAGAAAGPASAGRDSWSRRRASAEATTRSARVQRRRDPAGAGGQAARPQGRPPSSTGSSRWTPRQACCAAAAPSASARRAPRSRPTTRSARSSARPTSTSASPTATTGSSARRSTSPPTRTCGWGRQPTSTTRTPSSSSARTSPTPRRCSTSPSARGCTCAPTWWRSATTSAAGTTPASRASSGASRARSGSPRPTPPSSTRSPPRSTGRRQTTSCASRWRSRTRSTTRRRSCPASARTSSRWRGAGPAPWAPATRRSSSPAARAVRRSSSARRRS